MNHEQTEIEVKQIVQQMKHLQYENQTRIGEIRAENMTQLKYAQEDHDLQEQEMLKDKREFKRLLREKEESTELQIQQLQMKHSELLRYIKIDMCYALFVPELIFIFIGFDKIKGLQSRDFIA